jgi:hypothetical protein
MSELSAKTAFDQAVDDAVSAAFGGDVPVLVKEMVDIEACARLMASGGSKLGFVFRVGDDEQPRVRVAFSDEEARLTALLTARWPAAADFIEKYGAGHILAETDGGDELRLFVTGVDMGEDASGTPMVGATLRLPSGQKGWLTMHSEVPSDRISEVQRGHAERLTKAGAAGMWIVQSADDQPMSLSFFTEQPTPDETLSVAKAQSGGSRYRATLDALQTGGRLVDPMMLEYSDGGVVDITIWGIQAVLRRADDLPDFFEPGSAPSPDAFATHLAMTVPDGDRDAVHATVVDRLYPALAGAVEEGGDAYQQFADAWRWLIGRLAKEVPFYRRGVLDTIATMASVKRLEVPAYHLALARYLVSHPDAKSDGGLPAEIRALSAADIQERARALTAELADLTQSLETTDGLGSKQVPILIIEAETVSDTLARAVSADFTAAVGLLHDFFMELGPGGYDDDPSLASLDDIDLDADAAEAAIEEALAMDYDDDDF